MLSKIPSFVSQRAQHPTAAAAAALLTLFLFVGTCGGGERGDRGGKRSGFVIAFKAGRIAVTAAWCEAPSGKEGS